MVTRHRFADRHPWPVTCLDCGDSWFAKALSDDYPNGSWMVFDERAIEIVRTGRLAARERQVTLLQDRRGWLTCRRGLVLVVAAHHHARGLDYDLTDDTWVKVTLLTLPDDRGPGLPAGVLDAAWLVLGSE